MACHGCAPAEREWFAACSAVRDSRAVVAVDIMAMLPVVSSTSLASGLGIIAVKNASAPARGVRRARACYRGGASHGSSG